MRDDAIRTLIDRAREEDSSSETNLLRYQSELMGSLADALESLMLQRDEARHDVNALGKQMGEVSFRLGSAEGTIEGIRRLAERGVGIDMNPPLVIRGMAPRGGWHAYLYELDQRWRTVLEALPETLTVIYERWEFGVQVDDDPPMTSDEFVASDLDDVVNPVTIRRLKRRPGTPPGPWLDALSDVAEEPR